MITQTFLVCYCCYSQRHVGLIESIWVSNGCLATSGQGSIICKKFEIFPSFLPYLNVSAKCSCGKYKFEPRWCLAAGGILHSSTERGYCVRSGVGLTFVPSLAFFADLNTQHSATQRTIWVKYYLFAQLHSRAPGEAQSTETHCRRMRIGTLY